MKERRLMENIVLLVFMALGTSQARPYYGLPLGKFLSLSNFVRGEVYAVDSTTLFVKGFSYDGLSHDAVFWAGHSEYPDKTGVHIGNKITHFNPLPWTLNQDFILTLPGKTTVQSLRWLAVWDRDQSKSLGSLIFLSPLQPPQPMAIGPLVNTKPGISTGDILISDTQTIMVPNFNYDGSDKEVYWILSRGMKPGGAGILLLQEDKVSPVNESKDATVWLRVPGDHIVEDYNILSIWSKSANDHYGFVRIPINIYVPPSLRILQSLEPKMEDFNCEVLYRNLGFEVRWLIRGRDIFLNLVGNIAPSEYMALVLSKDKHRSSYEGADAILAGVDKNGRGFAEDYYIERLKECRNGGGICPDTFYGSQNNLQFLNVERLLTEGRENFTSVMLKRHLRVEDKSFDQVIYTNEPQAISWAVGTLNSKGYAGNPTVWSIGKQLLDFGRERMWNCAPLKPVNEHRLRKHEFFVAGMAGIEERIHCPYDRRFRAQLGVSPRNSSQKVWYINGIPSPELVVQRGVTYTFIVEGGLSPPFHHPFYITNSKKGGLYKNLIEENGDIEVTYAGVARDPGTEIVYPTAEGRLCFWSRSDVDPEFSVVTYETAKFQIVETPLRIRCKAGKPGKLFWTPTAETPNEVYYQSFSEQNLGAKIRVLDFCEETNPFHYIAESATKGSTPNVNVFSQIEREGDYDEPEWVAHIEGKNFSIDENIEKTEQEVINEKYPTKPDKSNVDNNFIYSAGISSDKLTERSDIGKKQQDLVNENITTSFQEIESSDEVFPHDESERSDKHVIQLENSRKSTNQVNTVLNSNTNTDDSSIKHPTHSDSEAYSVSAVGKPFRQGFQPQFEGGFIPLVTNPMKEKESVQKKEFVLPPHHQNRPRKPFLYNESVPFHGTFKPGVPDFSGFNISNYSQEDASVVIAPFGQDNLALLSAPKPHSVPRNFPPVGAMPIHLIDRSVEFLPGYTGQGGPMFQSLRPHPSFPLVEIKKNTVPNIPVNNKKNFPIPNVRSQDLAGLPSQRVYVSMQTTGEKKGNHHNIPNLNIPSGYNRNVQNSQQGKFVYPPAIQRRPDFYEEKGTNMRHPNDPQRKFNMPQGFLNANNKQNIHQSGNVPLVQSGILPPQNNNRPTHSNQNIPQKNFEGSAEKIMNPQRPSRLPYPLMNVPQRQRLSQNPLFFKSAPIRSNPILFEKSNMNNGYVNHPHVPGLMLPLPIQRLNHTEVLKETPVMVSNSSQEQRHFHYLGNSESAEVPSRNIPPTVTKDKPTINQEMIIPNLPFNETLGAFVLSTNLKGPQSVPSKSFLENKPSANNPNFAILNDKSVNAKGNVPVRMNSGEKNPVKSQVLKRGNQNLEDKTSEIIKVQNDQLVKYDEPHGFNSRPASFLDHEIEKHVLETLVTEDFPSSKDSKQNPVPYLDYEHEDNSDSSDSIVADDDYLHYNVPFGARLKFPQNGSRVPIKSIDETPKIPSRINRRPEKYTVNNSNRNSDSSIKSIISTTSTTSTTRPATAIPSTISTTDATLIAMESAASSTFNEKQSIHNEKEDQVRNLYYEPPYSTFHLNYEYFNSSSQDTKSPHEIKYTPIIADTLDDIAETGFLGRKNILQHNNSNFSFPQVMVPPNVSEDINLPQISDNPPAHDNRTDYSILNHVLTLIGGPP